MEEGGKEEPLLTRPRVESGPNAFAAAFPPLVVKPRPKDCLIITAFIGSVVGTLAYARQNGIDLEDLLKYLSIPVVSVLFTYFHIWVALYMTFYPLRFKGCLQIPGTNVGCGWQGIVPSKGEKMARISVRLMTEKLLDVGEVFSRIDPAILSQELSPVLKGMLRSVINAVAVSEEPAIWAKLPSVVKEELVRKAQEEAPEAIEAMMLDVQTNIHSVFDLSDMVVTALVKDPGLLNYMFIKCGYDELKFIRDCGAYMGGIFGVIQVALWVVYSEGWMLPAFGLVVGLLSNWIALKMIFEPVEPRNVFGGLIVIQGLFLKRQKEVSCEYGRIVSSHVLNAKYLIPAVMSGRCADAFIHVVSKHVRAACDSYLGGTRPMVKMVSGEVKYNRCKEIVGSHIIASLSDTMRHCERYINSAMDLENLLREKMTLLSPKDFEGLLHPVFQEDEWKLVLMGGVLGLLVGFMQWWALGS